MRAARSERMFGSARMVPVLTAVIVVPVALGGCGARGVVSGEHGSGTMPRRPSASHTAGPAPEASAADARGSALPNDQRVAPLDGRVRPDLLVRSGTALPTAVRHRLREVPGVSRTTTIGIGSTALRDETVTVAAVDASAFRAFAPKGTAESGAVWQRVAAGDLVVAHAVAKRLNLPLGGTITVDGTRLRIGAFATTVPRMDVIVDRATGRRLGLRWGNGVVAASDSAEVSEVAAEMRRLLGKDAHVERIGDTAATDGPRRAFLTGDEAAEAFGTFEHHWRPDGSLRIDPAFVRANIRTERVPILGEVRCHRLMFPQLRGALQEVVDRGLGFAIHPDQYGGCFVPKGIEGSPGAISLHTWGIAIDLNVPENLRGTEGKIDRRVVKIFKRWGFAWGGDWSWTDPMHFEMAGVLKR